MTITQPAALFVGQLFHGSTAEQRKRALEENGFAVTEISTVSPPRTPTLLSAYSRCGARLARLGFQRWSPPDLAHVRSRLFSVLGSADYNLLWLDKVTTLPADALAQVRLRYPRCRVVGYSPDDMLAAHNRSRRFLSGLRHCHHFLTTKSYAVSELAAFGCPDVRFVDNAYDPSTHAPMAIDPTERARLGGPVGFVGAWEPERAQSLYRLADSGVPVRVWGTGWDRCKHKHPNLFLERRPQWAEDYARTLCSFDINLCFLRKVNRDRQTTRSVEIPACGAFMLAERTPEHQCLFQEGKEAEYFDSDEELIVKVQRYLQDSEARHSVAAAGLSRCRRSGYSYASRFRAVLPELMLTGGSTR